MKNIREQIGQETLQKTWSKVEQSSNMKDFWEAVEQFRPRKGVKGEGIESRDWVKHFKKLLAVSSTEVGQKETCINMITEEGNVDEAEIWNRSISVGEVGIILGRMKNKKAPGEDGITVEYLKNLPLAWTAELADIIDGLWKKGELIKGWETARIILIHKGDDELDTNNYRGIALLDIGYKLLTKILAARLKL